MYKNNSVLLKTLKSLDFLLWLNIIDIYYKGYHTILEGKYIIDAIKLHLNKGAGRSPCYAQPRLTTNVHLLKNKERISNLEIERLLSELYLLASPYEVRGGVRYYRDSNKLVSE